jgi:hypothetical protein
MKQKIFTAFDIGLALICIGFILVTGCAQQVAPSGGPRDSLPPLLVIAKPGDSALNFTGNKIVFTFNEYIQLDNIHDNLLVSPTPKREPVVEAKLKSLTIKIKDTLEENTTYSYNFGKAIKDVNEGNPAKNLTYVFSTGKVLDSLELHGMVLLAETGKADSTLIVMLHRNKDDSAVIKDRPRYYARLDSSGHYWFRNLPSGTFYLYALKDDGGQKKYISKTQLFGFADKPVIIGKKNDPVTLYAYLEKDTFGYKAPEKNTKPAANVKPEKTKELDKRLKFANNLSSGSQDLLSDLEFIFPNRLKKFDSSKLQFLDETFKPIKNYTVALDSSGKKMALNYKWPENTAFAIIVDKEFAEDSLGRKIPRTDTLLFRTLKESDYGKLSIRFNNIDFTKNPVLQLMQNDDMRFSQKITSKDFHLNLFKPGEYQIRVLFDDNNNGIWDPGDFFGKHLQPERVLSIPKKLTIKANWDNDITIEL